MTADAKSPAPAVPLFCGVCAEDGKFTRLTDETAQRVEANGIVIVACDDHVKPVAAAISRVYGWAFVEPPESVNLILNPPPAPDDEEEQDVEPAEFDDDEEQDPGPVARDRVKAAPPAPVAAIDEDGEWDDLLNDVTPKDRPKSAAVGSKAAGSATTRSKPKAKKPAPKGASMVAPKVDFVDAPELTKEEERQARAWAIASRVFTSEGKPVGERARLHRSIKLAWVQAGRPNT